MLNSLGEWRNNLTTKFTHKAKVDVELPGHGALENVIWVLMPGKVKNRLQLVENQVATLQGRFDEATRAAIADALAGYDANAKAFAVKDISWAVAGVGLTGLGSLVSLVGLVLSS